MTCTCNGGAVPVVTAALAEALASQIPWEERKRARDLAFDWLSQEDGLPRRRRLAADGFTEDERDEIALEVGNSGLLSSRCPFGSGGSCAIGGLRTCVNAKTGMVHAFPEPATQPPYTFLPTGIAKALDLEGLRQLVVDGGVSDAKVTLLSRPRNLHRPLNQRADVLLGSRLGDELPATLTGRN